MLKKYDESVLTMYDNGMSVMAISKAMGISRQCVYNILNRNFINYKKPSKKVNIDAIKEEMKYSKMKQVMLRHDLTYAQMKKIMKEENIEKREIMKDILKIEDVRRLFHKYKMSDKDIAQIFNCSEYTVRSFRWKNGIYLHKK